MSCSLAALVFVTAFAYSPRVSENDADPWTTACGTRPRPGTAAVSQDLFRRPGYRCGDRILVSLGASWRVLVVSDTMHRRHRRTVDVWIADTREALRFGRKGAVMCTVR